MYQCPINYFMNNLIFNRDKSCWAVFKLVGYDYDFLDNDVKIAVLYNTARFLAGVMSEAQVLIVPVEQDTKSHFRDLIKGLDKKDVLYEKAKYHAENTEAYLEQFKEENGQCNDYSTYIVVKLEKSGNSQIWGNIKYWYEYFVKDPVNALNVHMNLDTRDILVSQIKKCKKIADDWLFTQSLKIKMEELSALETQWLIRRVAFRGINKRVPLFDGWKAKAEQTKVGKEPVVRPYSKDIIRLFSGTIYPESYRIRIEHSKEEMSYQTFLSISHLPDSWDYPGTEWIYMLQQKNMQAEVCIHIKAKENRTAQNELGLKKREIDSQMNHIADSNASIPEELLEGQGYADALEKELKDSKAPLLYSSVTICVAADNEELLEHRTAVIREEFSDLNFIVERSLADQVNLFMQCIPSVSCMVTDYIMPLTPITLASGVIGATHELGDRNGPFIGTTGRENKPVYLDMGQACLKNKSASGTFYGNLGVGKSFNANLLVVLNVLYGGYGLIFDPKAERGHWEEQLTILKGLITTVSLSSAPENIGKLDPYNIFRDDPKAADELAINVLSELLKIAPTSLEYTAILEAQRIMSEQVEVPCMKKLIDILGRFPAEDELCKTGTLLARRLALQARSGMSQLLFGDGTEVAINLDNRLNIIQIDNLKLPSPETPKENYTAEENLSTVLMAVVSNFAKRFAMTKRNTFSLILFDESWALGKTIEGVKLYDFLTRMGRSLFTGVLLNGHSVTDLPTEGIKNTITYKFCFQTQNEAEAVRMCEYMGINASPRNIDSLMNLGNGECLFQDLAGHVGKLKFDVVFQDFIDVFSTTPKKEVTEEPEPVQDEKDTISEEEQQEAMLEQRAKTYDFEYDDDALYRME